MLFADGNVTKQIIKDHVSKLKWSVLQTRILLTYVSSQTWCNKFIYYAYKVDRLMSLYEHGGEGCFKLFSFFHIIKYGKFERKFDTWTVNMFVI